MTHPTLLKILASLTSLASVTLAMAATHEVMVEDIRFEPKELTIAPGDTVRWINSSSGFMLHDVTADDGSFQSETAAIFEYEMTFDDPGDIPYHCTVHSTPAASGGVTMNGTITVEGEDPAFFINPGINDAWFNSSTAGQGFFIIVFDDRGEIFLSWFTYDTERPPEDVLAILGEPGHRWLTAQGPFDGDTAMLEVFQTEGGIFDSAEPKPETGDSIGTITIVWHDCENGTLTYDIDPPKLAGSIEISRITLDNVPLCEELNDMAQED